MSIIIVLTIIALVWRGATAVARLAVDAMATAIGLVLFARAAHVRRRIVAMREGRGTLDFDRRPSRAERRLMAAGLKHAIRQAELRSLLPVTTSRAERIVTARGF